MSLVTFLGGSPGTGCPCEGLGLQVPVTVSFTFLTDRRQRWSGSALASLGAGPQVFEVESLETNQTNSPSSNPAEPLAVESPEKSHGGNTVRVLVWDERQEEQKPAYGGRYLGECLAERLTGMAGLAVRQAWRDQPHDGLCDEVLDQTDVVVWWSHRVPRGVSDETADRVVRRVMNGSLGLIVLHSAHWSKPFVHLMHERTKSDAMVSLPAEMRGSVRTELLNDSPYGKAPRPGDPFTPSWECSEGVLQITLPSCVFPSWRADGKPSLVTTLLPEHPIAAGLPETWVIPQTEMYADPFHVPEPDAVIFREDWEAGESFRSGCLWRVGCGGVFYFGPGHETWPIYQQQEVLTVIANAARFLGSKQGVF
jgi:trehalose utilization protein